MVSGTDWRAVIGAFVWASAPRQQTDMADRKRTATRLLPNMARCILPPNRGSMLEEDRLVVLAAVWVSGSATELRHCNMDGFTERRFLSWFQGS